MLDVSGKAFSDKNKISTDSEMLSVKNYIGSADATTVATIGNGYREGIGQLGEKMHIIGHRHLQGHFDIHLHVIVKRQESPKNR